MVGRTRVVAGMHSKVWLERMHDATDRLEIDYPVTRAIADIIEADEPAAVPAEGHASG